MIMQDRGELRNAWKLINEEEWEMFVICNIAASVSSLSIDLFLRPALSDLFASLCLFLSVSSNCRQ